MNGDENDDFIQPLKLRISKSDILEDCASIRKDNRMEGIDGGNKNAVFGMTIDFLKSLVSFKNPSTRGIAYLLYGNCWDEEKKEDSGYLRLSDQRCGRKSFIAREQEFWYDVGVKALGENVIGQMSPAQFVRTPLPQILKRAKDMDLSIPWERLNPVLVLQLLAMMGGNERFPTTLTISKVKNLRLTPQGPNQNGIQFIYTEQRDTYQIGQLVNLIVENLGPSEDFAIVEYSHRPHKEFVEQNVDEQAQYWKSCYRNGVETHAFLLNSDGEARIPLGKYGQLAGDHGFCVVTYPRKTYGADTRYGGDPFGLVETEGLLTIEEFQDFALKLRKMMFHDPGIRVNLTEFNLQS